MQSEHYNQISDSSIYPNDTTESDVDTSDLNTTDEAQEHSDESLYRLYHPHSNVSDNNLNSSNNVSDDDLNCSGNV